MGPDKGVDRQRRVYVIEDDEVARGRMVDLLERHGYAVTVVPSLDAAITQGFWSGDPDQLLFVGHRRENSGGAALWSSPS